MYNMMHESSTKDHESGMILVDSSVGIGYIDVHLLASTALAGEAQLWTRDRRLHRMACTLQLAW